MGYARLNVKELTNAYAILETEVGFWMSCDGVMSGRRSVRFQLEGIMETERRIVIRCQRVIAVATTLFAILSIPGMALAQEHAVHHHHYKFIDLGTLGGPHSYGSPNGPGSRLL